MLFSSLVRKRKRKLRRKGQRRKRERFQRRLKTQSLKRRSEGKRKRSQGPGSQARRDESVNMQEVVDSLRKQAVLAGRVFDI